MDDLTVRDIKSIGYIKFSDHSESIVKMKPINDVKDNYQVITDDGLYIYDMSEPNDNVRCRLYKQVVTRSMFPQSIKSELHVCEFDYIRIYND